MRTPTPSRRRFLAGGLAAAAIGSTAGCLGGSLNDDANGSDGDRVLTLILDDIGTELRDRYVDDPAESDVPWDKAAFDAVRNDETYTTQSRKPFFSSDDDPTYAVHDGTYYRLDSVIVDEAAITRPVLRLFGVDDAADDGASDSGPTATDDLPEVDRRAVEIAYFAARARGDQGGYPVGLVQRGGYVYRDGDAAGESALLDEGGPDRVRFRDETYRVAVARERFHEPVYRATGEPIAESTEGIEAVLRGQFVGARVDGDELSEDAVVVLEEARYGGHSEPHPFSEEYEEVLRAIHERPYLDGDVENDARDPRGRPDLVRYDGQYYDRLLRFEPAE